MIGNNFVSQSRTALWLTSLRRNRRISLRYHRVRR